MPKHWYQMVILVVVGLAVLSSGQWPGVTALAKPPAGLPSRLEKSTDVKIRLNKAKSIKDLKIILDEAETDENDSIESLLKKRGITPNRTAMGIVLDLNPNLNRTRELAGKKIVLPAIDVNNASRNSGLRVTLESSQDALKSGIDKLQSCMFGLIRNDADVDQDTKTILTFSRQLADYTTDLNQLNDNKLLVSPAAMKLANAEAIRLSKYLDKQMKTGKLTERDLSVIKSMQSNLSISTKEIKSGNRGSKHISTHTFFIDGGNKNASKNYKVFFIAEGFYSVFKDQLQLLEQYSEPYMQLSTPTESREIMSGDYRFWAKRGEAVSELQIQKIRSNSSNNVVEITVPEL